MKIGKRNFNIGKHTYIMGILNCTSDSFSDGGQYTSIDRALFRVEEMLQEGMDILDIGGESTRPGYIVLSTEEEIQHVVPVIEAVKKRFDIPVSLDTYKSDVVRAGLQAGCDLINDIWGLKYDADTAGLIAGAGVPCVLMHNRKEAVYTNFIEDVLSDIKDSVNLAHVAGIDDNNIILDPGIGFAKSPEQNLLMMNSLEKIVETGYPVLLGASRKSVIGLTLDLPVTQRMEGTLVTTVMSVLKGCSFVRVHDIKENARAVKMAEAILFSNERQDE